MDLTCADGSDFQLLHLAAVYFITISETSHMKRFLIASHYYIGLTLILLYILGVTRISIHVSNIMYTEYCKDNEIVRATRIVSSQPTRTVMVSNALSQVQARKNCPFFQSRFSQWIHVP